MKTFADRLLDAIDDKHNPSCVGFDPHFKNVPNFIKQEQRRTHGPTLKAIAESFVDFNRRIIDAFHDVV